MSKVISFRLNPENPREAQAFAILRAKQAEGFSYRQVLTDALIGMATEKGQSALFSIDEFNEALEKVSGLLERLDVDDHNNHQTTTSRVANLNNNFVNSVKIAVKPGLTLD